MENITPNYKPHKNLEFDVIEYLTTSRDFLIYEATYHSIAPSEIVRILQARYTPTALYLRGRADRVAIHKIYTCEFEFECKTHISRRYHDCTIELLPLLHHISKLKLGVDCLYIYRNNLLKDVVECGFWISDLPEIREIWIPPTQRNDTDFFLNLVEMFLPNTPVVNNVVGGSGDPFIIIDQSTVEKLKHWKDLVGNLYMQAIINGASS